MPTYNYPPDFTATMWRILDGDIYVSYSGHDISGGGSPLHPFATIQYAIDQASSGQRIIVGTGAYNENVDGGNKSCVLVADGTVSMDGTTPGGNAFSNMGANSVIFGFRISNYNSSTYDHVLRFEQCLLDNADILGTVTTLSYSVMRNCDVLNTVTDFLNCTFLNATKPDVAGGVTVENCHFDADSIFHFDSSITQFFDNCNQENGSTINIDGTDYANAADVNTDFAQYQSVGLSDHPLFNKPSIDDYTLQSASTLAQSGTHSQPIGAYPVANAFNGPTLGSTNNVIIDSDGFYTLAEDVTEGTVETKPLDLGSLRTLGRIDLFAENFFSPDFFGSVTFNQDTTQPPRPITFQMKYAPDRESILKTEYKEFIWDKMPVVDLNGRGNGNALFNPLTVRIISARFIQVKITLRHTTEPFFIEQENADFILQENGSKIKQEIA